MEFVELSDRQSKSVVLSLFPIIDPAPTDVHQSAFDERDL